MLVKLNKNGATITKQQLFTKFVNLSLVEK